MPLTTSYYLQRAAELEALAPHGNCGTRKEYMELAQRFRDVASRVSVSRMEWDEEARLGAESGRMFKSRPVIERAS